jgi:hypothetical protein
MSYEIAGWESALPADSCRTFARKLFPPGFLALKRPNRSDDAFIANPAAELEAKALAI